MNLKNKKIYFRFDAGNIIGFGHYHRCLSIANELKHFNIESIFVIRKRPSLKNFITKYDTIWLDEIPDVSSDNVSEWIHQDFQTEFLEMIKNLGDTELIFIDHYGLDSNFHSKLKNSGYKVFGFKDYDDFNSDFTLSFDYRPSNNANLNNSFIGLEYVPLNSDLKSFKTNLKNESKIIGVYLGGVEEKYLDKALSIFLRVKELDNFEVTWIIGSEQIRQKFKSIARDNFSFIPIQGNMFNFYNQCSLFVGAFGVSFFERAYLGTPQLNFMVAENQKSFSDNLVNMKLAVNIGNLKTDSKDDLEKKIKRSLRDVEELHSMAKHVGKLIDCAGSKRIAKAILNFAEKV